MRRALLVLALGLLMVAAAITPVAALTEHCPDHEGNPAKVQSVNPGDLDEVVLPAGTLVCVKASNLATGIVTADGEESLCDILIEAGIVDGTGEDCANVSYYVTYEPEDSVPPPSESVAPPPSESAAPPPSAEPSEPTGNVDFPSDEPTPSEPTGTVDQPDLPDTAVPLVQNMLLLVGLLLTALGSMLLINWADHRRRG